MSQKIEEHSGVDFTCLCITVNVHPINAGGEWFQFSLLQLGVFYRPAFLTSLVLHLAAFQQALRTSVLWSKAPGTPMWQIPLAWTEMSLPRNKI